MIIANIFFLTPIPPKIHKLFDYQWIFGAKAGEFAGKISPFFSNYFQKKDALTIYFQQSDALHFYFQTYLGDAGTGDFSQK
jgi:hypothetical protein